jgi:Photosynthetic reaction centre cytochrome C subunit
MKTRGQRVAGLVAIGLFVLTVGLQILSPRAFEQVAVAQVIATPTPSASPLPAPSFDQAAALAKLREQIKGRESEPSTTVYKNIQTPFLRASPAGRVLAVMEIAYARSLGVTCTHCHIPDKWEADDKTQKQTARDMAAMMSKINGELLPGIKNLKSEKPTVNCTTCHRGEVKPALNLPAFVKAQ